MPAVPTFSLGAGLQPSYPTSAKAASNPGPRTHMGNTEDAPGSRLWIGLL